MHRCTISHIDPDSPLRHAAHPGDRLVSINGNPITDVLDYKYYAYDPELAVCLRRPDGTEHTVHVSKPLGGELGLDFETYLMDNAHSCANHCVFCSSTRCRRACVRHCILRTMIPDFRSCRATISR